MKYVIVQGDGMGDLLSRPDGNPTPLEASRTPNLDRVAGCGEFGLIHTIPGGFPPGSDVGNLALFGYDPRRYYTGRSPLEAAAMGVALGPEDVSFRLNLVTLSGEGDGAVMRDYSGGHIETEPAAELVGALSEALADDTFQFFPGVSYRHLLVWRGGQQDMTTVGPHDLSDQPVAPHLPHGPGAEPLLKIMAASRRILGDHPVNRERVAAGHAPISQAWLWGQGKAPSMPPFRDLYGLRGAAISAVDLVRGVAVYAGFDLVHVPGATGYLDTDYGAKGEYALRALEDHDLVFVHIEAPDEAGHMGNRAEKIKAIEAIDEKIIGPLLHRLPRLGPFRLMVTSDHATPISLRTHTHDPVPYAIVGGEQLAVEAQSRKYGESEAGRAGNVVREGFEIIGRLLAS